jgi:hypothetical protein
MSEVVTLEPWSPWPLVFPAVVLVAAVMASIVGARFRSKPMREAGYVAFVIAALAAIAMTWTLSGIWDTQQRTAALVELGYESVTFSGSSDLSGGELRPIAFQAERDGERVRGVLRPLGGERWEVAELGG